MVSHGRTSGSKGKEVEAYNLLDTVTKSLEFLDTLSDSFEHKEINKERAISL